MKIAGSTTLITGGASGLGRATAQRIREAVLGPRERLRLPQAA